MIHNISIATADDVTYFGDDRYVFRLILKKVKSLFFHKTTLTYRCTFFLCYYLPKLSNNVYSLKFYQGTTPSFTILVKTRK